MLINLDGNFPKFDQFNEKEKESCIQIIDDITHLAEIARQQGLMRLETEAEDMEDDFLKYMTLLIADASDPEVIENRGKILIATSGKQGCALLQQYIILDGMLMIQEGMNPRTLRDLLCDWIGIDYKIKVSDDGILKKKTRPIDKVVEDLNAIFDELNEEKISVDFKEMDEDSLMHLCLFIDPKMASELIAELPKEKRMNVILNICKSPSGKMEFLYEVRDYLNYSLISDSNKKLNSIDSIQIMADILNAIDRSMEKYIFDELYKTDAKLADEIRKRMFCFKDVTHLDSMSIQRFLRDVDSKDLVVGLKGAPENVCRLILSNMSTHNRKRVIDEMNNTHNVRMRDVDEAQQRMCYVIRCLEEQGELIISKYDPLDKIVK